MSSRLINLASFSNVTEAYVLVAKLETEGIACFLRNEHIFATQPLSHALGGIEVQVREEDFDRASVFFTAMEERKKEEAAKYYIPSGFNKALIFCPECESSEVYYKKPFFFSLSPSEYYCCECNYLWRER